MHCCIEHMLEYHRSKGGTGMINTTFIYAANKNNFQTAW